MKNLTLSLLASICIVFAATAEAQVAPEQARNFQINATHTGAISSDHLIPPLRQRWVVNFGQPISYPLIADGKVYVTVRNAGSGTTLYSLNAATDGATIWSSALGGNSAWSAVCHENLSGVQSAQPQSPVHFLSEGANQTQQVTVTDKAGNTATWLCTKNINRGVATEGHPYNDTQIALISRRVLVGVPSVATPAELFV